MNSGWYSGQITVVDYFLLSLSAAKYMCCTLQLSPNRHIASQLNHFYALKHYVFKCVKVLLQGGWEERSFEVCFRHVVCVGADPNILTVTVTWTHWLMRDVEVNLQSVFSNSFYELISRAFPVKLFPGECYRIPLVISHHWFRQRLGAVRQQAIAWANVDQDLCCQMASLRHNVHLTVTKVNQVLIYCKTNSW